jgi:hypothetical protein
MYPSDQFHWLDNASSIHVVYFWCITHELFSRFKNLFCVSVLSSHCHGYVILCQFSFRAIWNYWTGMSRCSIHRLRILESRPSILTLFIWQFEILAYKFSLCRRTIGIHGSSTWLSPTPTIFFQWRLCERIVECCSHAVNFELHSSMTRDPVWCYSWCFNTFIQPFVWPAWCNLRYPL